MPRNFERLRMNSTLSREGPGFWLRVIGIVLALLNCVALFLYLDPPGGTRRDLTEQSLQVRNEIAATRTSAVRLKTVAANVQLGNSQSSAFESIYFLPRRTAYQRVIGELQRMAAVSGLQEGDRVYSEEPIEGTTDLTLLNIAANNYQGTYDNLMHFLYEVDKSPMLLMLDTLLAAPQQTGSRVSASLRFQAVIQEEASPVLGSEP